MPAAWILLGRLLQPRLRPFESVTETDDEPQELPCTTPIQESTAGTDPPLCRR